MNINYIEGNCPVCGAKTKESCNTWVYGSPIRTCSSCKSEYLDKRWREVAIVGFDPRSGNASFYLKGFLGFFLFTIVCISVLVLFINLQGYYPNKLLGCIFAGALGTVLCGFLFARIKLGFEDKNNAKYMEESKKRIENNGYIEKLKAFGYPVPDDK